MTTERDVVESCVCHKVRMAARAVTRAYDAALRPVGLRATQFAVLVAVATEGALSITALAQAMGMDRSTLTRNVRPLVNDGLLAVGREGWHRSRTVEMTEQGRARVCEALPLWERAQARLQRQLGAPQWTSVHQSLEALSQMA
jgi:DNA-binding MarR family transcriptional regulator